jgi:tetratricopeptide repeat protein
VPHYLWRSADKLNKAGLMWDGPGQLLILALFLYFAPGGFWLGYVGTRTILTKLFDTLERANPADVDTALSEPLKIDAQGKIDPPAAPKTRSADAALLALPVSSLTDARQLAAWGAAKARANDLESAAVALQQASQADPSFSPAKQALATVYAAQSRKDEAQKLLQDEDTETGLFISLHYPAPQGFTKALEIGNRLLQRPGAANNLNLHIWLACAYGQQHAWAKAASNTTLMEEARKAVVREVKTAVGIDPQKAKPLLRSLWQPPPGSSENDLGSIPSDDSDLKGLLD